jgi:ribosome maturation factor RimP
MWSVAMATEMVYFMSDRTPISGTIVKKDADAIYLQVSLWDTQRIPYDEIRRINLVAE